MSVSADWSEVRALVVDLSQAGPKTMQKARAAVTKAAFDVQAKAQGNAMKLFRPPPTGQSTGATANSIGVDLSDGNLSAVIGPSTYYSPYLEFGTRYMAARPFMSTAFDAVQPGFVAAMEQLGGDVL